MRSERASNGLFPWKRDNDYDYLLCYLQFFIGLLLIYKQKQAYIISMCFNILINKQSFTENGINILPQ
jgi:hypothetical protein